MESKSPDVAISTPNIAAGKLLASLIEMREGKVAGHSRRVADLSRRIAMKLGMVEPSTPDVFFAALLHDVGKLGWRTNS